MARRLARKLKFVLALSLVAVPAVAVAQDHVVCVTPGGPVSNSCVSRPCDEFVDTAAQAISAAESYVSANGTSQVNVCVIDVPVLPERLVVDNTNDRLGSPLTVNFVGNSLCPGSADEPGEPAIEWIAGSLDFLVGLNIDFRPGGTCGTAPRPGVDVVGDGSIFLTGALRGTSQYGIRSGATGLDGGTQIRNSAITDCDGAAVIAERLTQIYKTQIVGCETSTTAIVEASGPDGLEFRNSLVAANRAGGSAPGIVNGAANVLENVSFVANVVESGIPVVALEPFVPRWILDGTALVQRSGNSVAHCVFSRNAAVSALSSLDLGPTPMVSRPQDIESEEVCADEGYASWMDGLDLSSADGSSPIVRYSDGGADSLATVFRSVFVGNVLGGSPLVEVRETEPRLSLQVMQNTASDNGDSALLEALELSSGDEVIVARNHMESAPPLDLGAPDPVGFLLISHNSGMSAADWTSGDLGGDVELIGPVLPSPTWRPASQISAQTACDQHLLRCPGHDSFDCQLFAARGALHCAVDRAAEFVPLLPLVFDETEAWPWTTDYFSPFGGEWLSTGDSGWSCEDIRPSVDAVPSLGFGDTDGFPDLVDCDNDDDGLVATVPENDGPWCVPAGDDDDDDDATTDDDDATTDDDDATTDDDDDASGIDDVPVGCSGRGCGLTFPTSGMALLFIAPFVRRRRIR